jgi:membrane-anchored mycosin MYCP
VAGILAGQNWQNLKTNPISFVGVAPEARLISIKVQNNENSGDNGQLLADGIEKAVQSGADIVNVSITNASFPRLHQAIFNAQRKGVLVVAAAGNTEAQKKKTEQAMFPASYDGVLSVGALSVSGPLSSFSNSSSRVDVAGPGDDITSTYGGGYMGQLQGTSFATPYVAGVAALIKSKMPQKTPRQIINRIIRTADGNIGVGSGAGMVNPVHALTDLGDDNVVPAPPSAANALPVDIGGPAPVDHHARTIGGLVAAIAIGAALLVVFAGVITPFGRRRGWRPGRVVLPAEAQDSGRD